MRLSLFKSTLLLLIFAIFSGTAAAQRIYSPGYIIQTADTLHGYVSYSGFGKESKQLYFRETEAAPAKIYSPAEINGFFYEGELFESAVVITEVSFFEMGLLKEGAELLLETDTVFLTQLVKGIKSLYFFTNRVGKEQFYIKVDAEFDLLLYKQYMREEEGAMSIFENKMTTIENKKYIGQLGVYMIDCPKISKDLRQLKYSKTSLSRLFWEYNACMGHTPEVSKGTKTGRFEFGVKAGLNYTSFNINKAPFNPYLNLDNVKNTYPVFGIFLNTYLQRNRRNLSFYNEIYYTTFYASGHKVHYENAEYYTIADSEIDYKGVNMMSALRYAVPAGAFNIYLNAGIAFTVSSRYINHIDQDVVYYTSRYQKGSAAIPDLDPSKMAPVLGIGATYKKFSFDVRFEKRGEHSSNYNVDLNTLYFMGGYRF